MASYSGPQGPSRPPPGYTPPPTNLRPPNPTALAGAVQNLQIGQPQAPFNPNSAPSGAAIPFGAPASQFPGQTPISRPAPPSRPSGSPFHYSQQQTPFGGPVVPPRPQLAGPIGSIIGNGPSTLGAPVQRLPPDNFQQQYPPMPSSRGPSPIQPLPQSTRPFPGSPPTGVSVSSAPLQPFQNQAISQSAFSAPPPMHHTSVPPPMSRIQSGTQQALPPFPGNPPPQPISGPPAFQGFPGRPAPQPSPGALPSGPQQFTAPPPPPSFSGPPTSLPFPGPGPSQMFSRPPVSASPYGLPAWTTPPLGPPTMPGAMQPPRMYGMANPGIPNAPGLSPMFTGPGSSPSKIDPDQIPRPMPTSQETIFETRLGNQANLPPPAGSEYVVRDNGNCSPRLMRCTVNLIPCTSDLISTSSMPLALMVQPLALPHPSEEPIQVVDFGESGPIRCSRCKGYINPFMKFIDQGKRYICNLCGFTDETPRDYFCNLGPDGRRRDADERPELCRGTVEFVATKEYMVRDPMPPVFFFLIDVSMNAVQTGATAAACSAIGQAIVDLPEGPRTMVGVATFDSTIHFYSLRRASQQPLMLIVPDVQDVYTPLSSDIIVHLTECRQHLQQLLESIPSMFENNRISESAFGAATKAAFLAMKPSGGKLLVFQSGKLFFPIYFPRQS